MEEAVRLRSPFHATLRRNEERKGTWGPGEDPTLDCIMQVQTYVVRGK